MYDIAVGAPFMAHLNGELDDEWLCLERVDVICLYSEVWMRRRRVVRSQPPAGAWHPRK
jgi:hypothetical protein